MTLNSNLSGKLLNVATNLSPPYVILEYEAQKREWMITGGFERKLLETLSEHYNFTYKIINCNSDWGTLLPNKTWTGIISKIVSKLADIGFAGLSITNDRSQAVDFTHQHILATVTFITSLPKTQTDYTLLIKPFEPSVWISLIIAFIFMSLNEWLIFQYKIEMKKTLTKCFIKDYSLKRKIICLLPSVSPLKMVACCWLLSCLVLTTSYGGCLYSLMTVPARMKTINSLEELAIAQRKGEIQVLATKGSTYYQEMKNSKSGIHREIGSLIKPVNNKIEGLDIVRNSTKPHAFISTRDHLRDAMLRSGGNLPPFYLPPQSDETVLNLDIMGIALQKKSEYKRHFNKFISNVQNGGLLDYWRRLEIAKLGNTREDFDLGVHSYDSIKLNQLQSAFYLFIIGISLTLILFLIEIFKNHRILQISY